MYVTAQRVVAATGAVGINMYRYAHGPGATPAAAQVLDHGAVGHLDAYVRQVYTEGGASVISYLDIVGDDAVLYDPKSLGDLLDFLPLYFPGGPPFPVQWQLSGVDFRFSSVPELQADRGAQELGRLARELRVTLAMQFGGTLAVVSPPQPLVVVVSRDSSFGYRVQFEPNSAQRLRRLIPMAQPQQVGLPHEVARAIIELHGHDFLYGELLRLLSSLQVGQVDAVFGGARFVDSVTGASLWQSESARLQG